MTARGPSLPSAIIGLTVLASAVAVWWTTKTAPGPDEYATIWFSDPALSIGRLYPERWAAETNPPLYYLLIRLIRGVWDSDIEHLRLAHLPVMLAPGCYLAACVAWHAPRRYYLSALALLYVSSGTCFHFFPELRSYFMQFALATMSCAALVLLRDPAAGDRRIWHLGVLAGCMLILLNLHFTGALLAGLLLAGGLTDAVLGRRWWLSGSLLAIGIAGALPAVIFVLLNAAMLAGRAEAFWITTTLPEALGYVMIVVRGAPSRNAVVALCALVGAMAMVRGRGEGDWRGVLLQAAPVGLFLAVMLVMNAVRPIMITKYLLETGAPMMSVLCLCAEPVLQRFSWGLKLVFLNAVAAIVPFALHPAAFPMQADASRTVIGGLARACPSGPVYGLWQTPDEADLYPNRYRIDAAIFGFRIEARSSADAWTPAEDPACPTLIWAEHAVGRDTIHDVAGFIARFRVVLSPSRVAGARLVITREGGLILVVPP